MTGAGLSQALKNIVKAVKDVFRGGACVSPFSPTCANNRAPDGGPRGGWWRAHNPFVPRPGPALAARYPVPQTALARPLAA